MTHLAFCCHLWTGISLFNTIMRKKCPKDAEDAEVSELCRFALLHPDLRACLQGHVLLFYSLSVFLVSTEIMNL